MVFNKNILIVIVIAISFFVVLSSMLILQHLVPVSNSDISKNIFFERKFDPDIKKIFILGSSQTGVLNTAHIMKKTNELYEDISVYNLSYDSDNPKKRFKSIEKTINLEPAIVLYGITFRDLESEIKTENSFAISQIKKDFDLDIAINPKLTTIKAIKYLLGETTTDLKNTRKINQINTPFTQLGIRSTVIIDDAELYKQVRKSVTGSIDFNVDEEQLDNYKKIISELKNNDIKVVLFSIPLPKAYLDFIPNSEREELYSILNNTAKEYDIQFYDFTEKYEELDIWSDSSHVAFNPKSMIYSDDITKIILSEINK